MHAEIHQKLSALHIIYSTITMSSSSSLKLFHSQLTLLLVIIFLICFASAASSGNIQRPFKRIYAFGDSITDTGNTGPGTGANGFRFASRPPYGRTFFHHPTNRYSDGRIVVDFLAQTLSLPFLPPYLNAKNADTSHGVDYAVGGATAISYDFFVKNNLTLDSTTVSIMTELLWFNKTLESLGCKGDSTTTKECDAIFHDSLFWIGEMGINDYSYTIGSSVSSTTIQNLALITVSDFLVALLNKGAKYIIVQGHPLQGCLPFSMSISPEDDRDDLGCVGSANRYNYNYNLLLQAKLHDLRVRFPHSVIAYADYENVHRTVLKNPSKFGFKEAVKFKACCGIGEGTYNYNLFGVCGSPVSTSCKNPAEFINWDGAHLTEAMYKVVTDMFLKGGYMHPSFDYLLSRKQQRG